MNEARAAVRYAKAILDLGVENKAIDQVEKDFRKIVATIADSPELDYRRFYFACWRFAVRCEHRQQIE